MKTPSYSETSKVLLAAVMAVALVTASNLHAATLTVTSTADSGPGTLRQALAAAANGDTIDATGVFGRIVLTGGELVVARNITILGPGSANLAVGGNLASRTFSISSNAVVSISGLTITTGSPGSVYDSNEGLIVLNKGGTLTLSGCNVSSNSVGSGIYNNGRLSMADCEVIGNNGYSGGGVINGGVLNASNCLFEGNSGPFGGGIANGGSAIIVSSTFSGNSAITSVGGGIYNGGTLAVSNSLFINNSASDIFGYSGGGYFDGGGGLRNDGEAVVVGSVFSGNAAWSDTSDIYDYFEIAGGAINNFGHLVLLSSTVTNNVAFQFGFYAAEGGGIFNAGTMEMTGCLLYANSAPGGGGGFYNVDAGPYNNGVAAILTVANCTLSSEDYLNWATLTVLNSTLRDVSVLNYGSLQVGSSILDAATFPNYFGFISLGYNLSSDGGGGVLTNANDLVNTDPVLAELRDNGGPTLTYALQCGSPALDSGTNFSGLPFDQRGVAFARTVDDPLVVNAAGGDGTDIGAFEVQHQCNPPTVAKCKSVTVVAGPDQTANASIDAGSFDPNGYPFTLTQSPPGPYPVGSNLVTLTVTDSQGASDSCSSMVVVLRDPVDIVTSTADGGPGTLRQALAAAFDGDTIDAGGVSGTILLTSGTLVVNKSVAIRGPSSGNLAVQGYSAGSVFDVRPGNSVTIANLTIANGIGQYGGGIHNDRSTLTVSNCTLSGNWGTLGGGGIGNFGTLTIANSTLAGNEAYDYFGSGGLRPGGGIYNAGPLTIVNSTLSGNSAAKGGGVYNAGSAGGAPLTVANSTLAGNGAYNSTGYGFGPGGGIYNDGSLGLAPVQIRNTILAGNYGVSITNAQGTVTSLGYNLSSDDGGGLLTATGDQLNTDPMLGPLQDNGGPTQTQALSCGSPAVGAGDPNFIPPPDFDQRGPGFPRVLGGRIDIGAFEAASFPSQTFTVLNTNDSGPGSLRQAVLDANASPGSDVIEFTSGAYGTITLTSGELLITDCLFINGPGPTNLAVSGNAASRVFHIAAGIRVTIAGVTVTNGVVPGNGPALRDGGGVYVEAALTISNCTLVHNQAPSGSGGGIAGGNLTIVDSSIIGNSARQGGGCIAGGNLRIVNSIVSGNLAGEGGGIYNGGGSLAISNSTLSGNFATLSGGGVGSPSGGGGIANEGGRLTIANSTLDGNFSYGGDGGGIFNHFAALTTTITYTTLRNNFAGLGGGIFNDGATLTIANSTLSGNQASDSGGGIFNDAGGGADAMLTISDSTLSVNSAYQGGGIRNFGYSGTASLKIANSTLSGNSATFGGAIVSEPEGGKTALEIGNTILKAGSLGTNIVSGQFPPFSTVTSLGYNLSSDGGGGVLTNSTDQVNTDPMIGPLADNGGPTFTHALLPGSPAIDKGKNFSGALYDQRGPGFVRTVNDPSTPKAPGGDGTDIGAFEVQNHPPVARCKNLVVSADASCTANGSIDDGSFDPDAGDTITLSQTPSGPYPLGTNVVTLTVTDSHGASNLCVALVVVLDTTVPDIACPTNLTVDATTPKGAFVRFSPTASDSCSGPPRVVCVPPSGSQFPIGTTTVTCTATDGAGNKSVCRFEVTVLGPREMLGRLIELAKTEVPHPQTLLASLDAALGSLGRGNLTPAINDLRAFQKKVEAQVARSNPALARSLDRAAQDIIVVLRAEEIQRLGGSFFTRSN